MVKGTTKRFGPRYGKKLRQKVDNVEGLQKAKHKCPYCNKMSVKRESVGIWYCKSCNAKFAGKAYWPGE